MSPQFLSQGADTGLSRSSPHKKSALPFQARTGKSNNHRLQEAFSGFRRSIQLSDTFLPEIPDPDAQHLASSFSEGGIFSAHRAYHNTGETPCQAKCDDNGTRPGGGSRGRSTPMRDRGTVPLSEIIHCISSGGRCFSINKKRAFPVMSGRTVRFLELTGNDA